MNEVQKLKLEQARKKVRSQNKPKTEIYVNTDEKTGKQLLGLQEEIEQLNKTIATELEQQRSEGKEANQKLAELSERLDMMVDLLKNGLAISNLPDSITELAVNNLKDIKFPTEMEIKNWQEQPEDLATNASIKALSVHIALAINKVATAVTKAQDNKSQEASAYVPYRRVIKEGNKLRFDDIPSNSGGIGGGGGSVPVVATATPNVFGVPVVNPDGTVISGGGGGGGAGDASAANQTSGGQKTQIVDAGGDGATVTGGKLDVNASIDTTGLATTDTDTNTGATSTNLGAKADSAATNDTGTFSLIALFKRLLQGITSLVSGQTAGNASLDSIDTKINDLTTPSDNQLVKLTDGTDIADILDLTNSNPLAVAMVDTNGDQLTDFPVTIAAVVDVQGTVTIESITNGVGGDVAHDAADSGNPIKIGGKGLDLGTTPTAVTANDRTNATFLRNGVQLSLGGSTDIVSKNLNITDGDGAQTDTAIVTVSAGTAIVVTKVSVMLDSATTATGGVAVRIGFGTANVPAADSNGIILAHPGISAGSGVVEGNGAGIIGIGASNEDLRVTCEDPVGGNLDIIVTYFTLAIG